MTAERHQATGLDLYGYVGVIECERDNTPEESDRIDWWSARCDRLPMDVRGDARVTALTHLAMGGLAKGLAPTEILAGCQFASNTSGYRLAESSIKLAVQAAIKKHQNVIEYDPTQAWEGKAAAFDPQASRIGDVFTVAPAAPRFIVPGYLPVACGQENAIGGAGKTTRRIYEGIHIILGRQLYGRPISQPGAVLAVTKEDGADVFKFRLHHVAEAMGLSAADQKRVAQDFHVLDMTGEVGGRLVNVDRAGNLEATDLAERIYQGYRQEGVAVVGFDPWNLFGPGERFVNDAEASLMAAGALVSRELSCNVCYVGHVSKAVGRGGIIDAHSGRGGAAMGDNARFVVSYVQHDPQDKEWAAPAAASAAAAKGDLYRLHITKQSYAKRQLEPIWIERDGHSFTVHEGAPIGLADAMQTDGERIKAFVRQELQGGLRYTARSLEEQHARYSMSRDRARMVVSWLAVGGGLTERPLPEDERRGRRTHYLEPVFADNAKLPASASEIFA